MLSVALPLSAWIVGFLGIFALDFRTYKSAIYKICIFFKGQRIALYIFNISDDSKSCSEKLSEASATGMIIKEIFSYTTLTYTRKKNP